MIITMIIIIIDIINPIPHINVCVGRCGSLGSTQVLASDPTNVGCISGEPAFGYGQAPSPEDAELTPRHTPKEPERI